MANIITTVSAENNVRMTNSQFARQPIAAVMAGWTTLRICLRLRLADTGANITGPPKFMVGLCAGSTDIIGDATPDHFVGISSDAGAVDQLNWPRTAGPPVYYGDFIYPMKCVAGVFTQGTSISSAPRLHTAFYKLFFVTITKGSPNYTFNGFFPDASSSVDATNADFLAQAVAGVPTLANHGVGTNRTLAVDEVADGTLTHVCAWWNQIGSTIDIADLQVFKVA